MICGNCRRDIESVVRPTPQERFPEAWFSNRIYAVDTVDAVLEDSAVRVDCRSRDLLLAEPPVSQMRRLSSLKDDRPMLAWLASRISNSGRSQVDLIDRIAVFTSMIENHFPSVGLPASQGFYRTPGDFWWGGPEEVVIAKGSDWCHEIARVFCAMAQVLEIPCRLVYTSSDDDGHVIAEAYWCGSWVLVDPLAPKVYRTPDGSPVSVIALSDLSEDELFAITASREGYYVNPCYFKHLFVAEYWLADSHKYNYGISRCNQYYEQLLGPIWNQ